MDPALKAQYDIAPPSTATAAGKGEQKKTTSLKKQHSDQESKRIKSSGAFGRGATALTFPRNTEGHPAYVQFTVVERVSGGLESIMSPTAKTPTGDVLGQINLYMPQTITFSDGLTYDNAELTGITSALLASANEAKNEGLLAGAGTLMSAGKAIMQDKLASATSAGQAVKAATGVAINPRASMLFKAPTFRQLALNFKLIPSNRGESQVIEDIVNYIRIHAYPELIAGGASFMFPNVFQISFISFNGPRPKIIPFNDAYCTGITVNYNATSPALMTDGSPSEVDLTVNFQETKVLDRIGIMKSAGIATPESNVGGQAHNTGVIGGT
tara:strand:+ start:216 stop:1196 length:981 start_codon:yes stop_codon:yes gene_type:complete